MARTSEDLKSLLLAGDGYTETIDIEYLGEQFAVEIRPLTEAEITDVSRTMKINASMLKKISEKVKAGANLSPEEREKLQKDAVDTLLSGDGEVDVGSMVYVDFLQNQEYCKRGIVDKGLRSLVPKFRYGLTEKIASRIKTISEVPPAVVQNFFGQQTDN
jgi:hypothetical protein